MEQNNLLENFLNEKGAEGIRLTLLLDAADHNLRLSLDAPQESDKIETLMELK